jgi:hypothetical protein
MTLVSPAPPMAPAAVPSSALVTAAPQLVANSRPVSGGFNFYPRVAVIRNQQSDRIGFDAVGASSQGWVRTEQQRDGSWLTTIDVPHGAHLGGSTKVNGDTDRFVKLSFSSKQQPTLNGNGRLFITGREITGDLLGKQLAKLGLPLPDFRNFTYSGTAPE